MPSTSRELCDRYLAALDAGGLGAVRALFTPDATVASPLYGVRHAHDFYAELFADTRQSETTLLGVFDGTDGRSVALHFRYAWTLASGKRVLFECVDVFELAPDRRRFGKLTIIYDTAQLRADFAELRH